MDILGPRERLKLLINQAIEEILARGDDLTVKGVIENVRDRHNLIVEDTLAHRQIGRYWEKNGPTLNRQLIGTDISLAYRTMLLEAWDHAVEFVRRSAQQKDVDIRRAHSELEEKARMMEQNALQRDVSDAKTAEQIAGLKKANDALSAQCAKLKQISEEHELEKNALTDAANLRISGLQKQVDYLETRREREAADASQRIAVLNDRLNDLTESSDQRLERFWQYHHGEMLGHREEFDRINNENNKLRLDYAHLLTEVSELRSS